MGIDYAQDTYNTNLRSLCLKDEYFERRVNSLSEKAPYVSNIVVRTFNMTKVEPLSEPGKRYGLAADTTSRTSQTR